PDAVQGQWFENDGVRSHEFYDNVLGSGGGTANSLAISGFATNVVMGGGGIVSFDVNATITNDLGTEIGPWADGANAHQEGLSTTQHYVGVMKDTKMTIEFALTDLTNQPVSWTAPYSQQLPEIIATNETDAAWYCYNSTGEPQNSGNYFVPAWDFGDIAINQSVNRTLSFIVNGVILPTDPRYNAIVNNHEILSNRTTSLKISNWVDTIAVDPGGPYDPQTLVHSNASVFHLIPEPSSLSLLGLAGISLLFRRRV
ncbi:MAG: PEP-CTERM sorting domain-containing protein, partial [Verrucomicrobiae bacterium]|nr:PEP-CTERM sorting domain-containing protein [Verrucomicrobiae bacterium]NNJ87262.1 PEP-CTERM sorting domain-containing protein [Akkermansiaceae bacterium]